MCDLHGEGGALEPLAEDQFVVDTPRVRRFVAVVRARIDEAPAPAAAAAAAAACELISPLFSELLADRDWLPAP